MKECSEASGRHKYFDYLRSQNGLRTSQISMFQLTLRKTDSERQSTGRHKRFDYMWTQNGLRMSQISMYQLTLRKTDSERQLQTSSCLVALDFFHSTSLNIFI